MDGHQAVALGRLENLGLVAGDNREQRALIDQLIGVADNMCMLFPGIPNTGPAMPDNYFVFDVETTGFDPKVDLIWSAGWAVVVDRRVVNSEDLILDWTSEPGIDQNWLRSRIERQQQQMAEGGRACHLTYERLRSGGNPYEALAVYYQLLRQQIQLDQLSVAHGADFDKRMIDAHAGRFLDAPPLPWRPNSILDTGLMEKAIQMNRPPYPGEPLENWYQRLRGGRSKVKWNLDTHCAEKYKLAERFGLDMSQAHGGGFDCRLAYALAETFRMIAENLHAPAT